MYVVFALTLSISIFLYALTKKGLSEIKVVSTEPIELDFLSRSGFPFLRESKR
jgi:hypothetical protein